MKHKNNSPDPRWKVGKLGSSIYSKARAYKFIATIFLVSLLVILFATTNMNPVQSCQNMQPVIKIIDESGGKRLAGTTIDTLQDSPFKNYVTAISQYLLPKISEMSQCKGELQGNSEVKIFFVYRPLITAKIAPFQLERMQSGSTKYLDSPWVKLAIGSSPKPFVQAVFVWSERQFLLDQALLSGAEASSTEIPLPIDEQVFGKFIRDYTDSVLLAASPEARAAAQVSISERLPKDILWLFRHSWQSTRGPFGGFVLSALDNATKQMIDKYVDLTKILLNHHFISEKTDGCYDSILSLKDLLTSDKYRINKLY
jgi:hypothetical protein